MPTVSQKLAAGASRRASADTSHSLPSLSLGHCASGVRWSSPATALQRGLRGRSASSGLSNGVASASRAAVHGGDGAQSMAVSAHSART